MRPGCRPADRPVVLLAVRRPGQDFEHNPGSGTELSAGMTLIAVGTDEQLRALADSLQGQ